MIRSRIINLQLGAIVADESGVTKAVAIMPKTGKIKSIKGWTLAKTGSNALQVGVYKSGAAASTAAASTTLAHSAVLDLTSDALISATMNTDGTQNFIEGEALYVKVTSGATTSCTMMNVQIEVDY